MPRVEMDQQSWCEDREAGLAGGLAICPPGVPDRLAFASGFGEGKALLSLSKGRAAPDHHPVARPPPPVTKIRSLFDAPQSLPLRRQGASQFRESSELDRCCFLEQCVRIPQSKAVGAAFSTGFPPTYPRILRTVSCSQSVLRQQPRRCAAG
jgi:hypothetical protein